MKTQLDRAALLPRLDGIQKNLTRLRQLAQLSFVKFSQDDAYDLAQHNLRLALEGIFHISTHILSRLPGGRADEYKEIARRMGKLGVVPKKFAEKKLVPMAGLRNILVHNYSDLIPERLHNILKKHLDDIEIFLMEIKKILKAPEQLGLTLK